MKRHPPASFLIAAAVSASFALGQVVRPVPYPVVALCAAATVAAAWWRGFRAGLLSTALGTVFLLASLAEARYALRPSRPEDQAAVLAFVVTALVGIGLVSVSLGGRRAVPRPGTRALYWLVAFVAANLAAAALGQGLKLIPGVSILFWPPSGIFVAALLMNPRPTWPWWVAGAFLAEFAGNLLWYHNPLHLALLYFAANAAEASAAALLVRSLVGGSTSAMRPLRLERPRNAALFAVLAAGVAPAVGATLIATADAILGRHEFWTAWRLVWLGDGTGILLSAPLTLAAAETWRRRRRIAVPATVEFVATCGLTLFVTWMALQGRLPTIYLTLPAIVWAAIRFQVRGAWIVLTAVTLTVAVFTRSGQGEFAGAPQEMQHRLIALQVYLAVCASTALIVAGLSALHVEARDRLRRTNRSLERRVLKRTDALRQSEERLREADRHKDIFMAALAHELRNPLAPIRVGLEVLRLAGQHSGAAERTLAMIERQVAQMARLIEDLMDVNRISRGEVQLRRVRMPLADALRMAVETSRALIDSRRHALVLSLPDDSLLVDGDPARLPQIFVNLLNNAAKYTDEGGRIELAARLQGNEVVVTVKDDGTGIPSSMLTRVFEVFAQADRSRDKGGLGLGLSIVKSLVEQHGGNVVAESGGPGKGSTFAVRLPAAGFVALDRPGEEREPGPPPASDARTALLERSDVPDLRRAMGILGTIVAECDHELRYVWIDSPHPDFRAQDVVGKRDDELMPPAEAAAIMSLKREILASGRPIGRVLFFDRSDGRRCYSLCGYPVRDSTGETRSVLTIGFDVDGRHADLLKGEAALAP